MNGTLTGPLLDQKEADIHGQISIGQFYMFKSYLTALALFNSALAVGVLTVNVPKTDRTMVYQVGEMDVEHMSMMYNGDSAAVMTFKPGYMAEFRYDMILSTETEDKFDEFIYVKVSFERGKLPTCSVCSA